MENSHLVLWSLPPAPPAKFSCFSGLTCICRHDVGNLLRAVKTSCWGGFCRPQVGDACGNAKCPEFCLSPGCLVEWCSECRSMPWNGAVLGLGQLYHFWSAQQHGPASWRSWPLHGNVATRAESWWKFWNNGGKDLSTLNTRLSGILLETLIVETFDRLWVPTPLCHVSAFYSRGTFGACPKNVRVWRWNFLCIPNLLTLEGLVSLPLPLRVECNSFVWNLVEGAKDATSTPAHFCCIVSPKASQERPLVSNCLRWMESSSECQMSMSASDGFHVFCYALGSSLFNSSFMSSFQTRKRQKVSVLLQQLPLHIFYTVG